MSAIAIIVGPLLLSWSALSALEGYEAQHYLGAAGLGVIGAGLIVAGIWGQT